MAILPRIIALNRTTRAEKQTIEQIGCMSVTLTVGGGGVEKLRTSFLLAFWLAFWLASTNNVKKRSFEADRLFYTN